MNKPRGPALCLTLVFLATIASSGLIQVTIELHRGEWPQALSVFTRVPTVPDLRAYEQELEEASWVVQHLRPWIQYAQFILLKDAGEKALIGRQGWLFYKPGVLYFCEREKPHPLDEPQVGPLRAIVAFRDQLEARDIRLLVVPGPNKESVYPGKLTRRGESLQGAVCRPTRTLLEALAASKVEVVDLFKVFAEARSAHEARGNPPLYLAQDSHWSPTGVALAAQAVGQRLLKKGWIEPGDVLYEGQPAPVERIGDLVRMLRVPQIEHRVNPERVPCVKVVRQEDGTPYRDDPNAEILVLGDSFLRIYERDEPGAAGFIAHLAKELQQPLASLVNDGGASTLVRQQLYRQPGLLVNKKVVIWQFVERDIRFGTEGWQNVPLPPAPSTTPLDELNRPPNF